MINELPHRNRTRYQEHCEQNAPRGGESNPKGLNATSQRLLSQATFACWRREKLGRGNWNLRSRRQRPVSYRLATHLVSQSCRDPLRRLAPPPGRYSLAKALRFSESIHQRISDSHVHHNRSHLDANAQRSIKTH